MLMRAILVRHGEARSNLGALERKVDEYADLTEKGKNQVLKVAKELGRFITTNTVYASPKPRTRQSAEIFADALGLQVVIDGRLTEVDKGEWRGKLVRNVMEEEAKVDPKERPTFRPPGGENWIDQARRMVELVEELRYTGVEQGLFISHNHPILCGTGMLLNLPLRTWEDRPLPNAGFIVVHHVDESWHQDIIGKDKKLQCELGY